MNIFRLLDDLEATIGRGKKPLLQNDKIIVEPDEIYGLIDQIRANMPEDIRDAQWVKKEEQRIIEKAKEEYERIIEEAQQDANRIASESEIVRLARGQAHDIVNEAKDTAHEITKGAFMYANDIMEKIEKQLAIYYDVVQEGKEEIQQTIDALNHAE